MDEVEKSFLEYFQIEKIDDNTFAIKEDKIGYKANCFLLLNKGEGILIDALSGVYQGFIDSLEHIFNVRIRKLYLTHAHYDHFGGYDKNKIEEVYKDLVKNNTLQKMVEDLTKKIEKLDSLEEKLVYQKELVTDDIVEFYQELKLSNLTEKELTSILLLVFKNNLKYQLKQERIEEDSFLII